MIHTLRPTMQVSPDEAVKVASFWHSAAMPHAAPTVSRDPEHYPDNPRADNPIAAVCVPSAGQYAPRGVLTLAILWVRSTAAGPQQRDIVTVELVVGDPQSVHKTAAAASAPADARTQGAVARGAAGVAVLARGAEVCESRVDSALGPWLLLYVRLYQYILTSTPGSINMSGLSEPPQCPPAPARQRCICSVRRTPLQSYLPQAIITTHPSHALPHRRRKTRRASSGPLCACWSLAAGVGLSNAK